MDMEDDVGDDKVEKIAQEILGDTVLGATKEPVSTEDP
jgi:hypothetical protein